MHLNGIYESGIGMQSCAHSMYRLAPKSILCIDKHLETGNGLDVSLPAVCIRRRTISSGYVQDWPQAPAIAP